MRETIAEESRRVDAAEAAAEEAQRSYDAQLAQHEASAKQAFEALL